MVVEKFKDASAVYRRFQDHGRLAPEGLRYVSSWTDERIEHCFQLMETDNVNLLNEWTAKWADLVDFEVFPVITSSEATDRMKSRL
jgi:hypothetical protein